MRSASGNWLLILLLLCLGCGEIQHRHFASLDVAEQEKLVEKGWIPAFSPDAKNIDFDSDLDAASVFGSYTSADRILLRKHCIPTDDSSRLPAQWPPVQGNKRGSTAGDLRRYGYEVLHCADGNFNVVLSDLDKSVYYWSIRGR